MKEILANLGFGFLQTKMVSLAAVVVFIVFMTPAFVEVGSFVQTVYANSRQIKEHERKFERVDMLDDKVSAMMIEMGIQKELRAIENRYKQQHNKGE